MILYDYDYEYDSLKSINLLFKLLKNSETTNLNEQM